MNVHLLTTACFLGLSPVIFAQATPGAIEAAAKLSAKPAEKVNNNDSAELMVPKQDEAQKIGERIYNTWRLSMMRGNKTTWSQVTTRSRQNKVRNLVISQRGNFDRDFFQTGGDNTPMLENFRYVGALAACKGRTLALTYVGRMQLGEGKPEDCALVLQFVQEGSDWKFDQSSYFSLKSLPEVEARLQKQDITMLKEQDGFHPYYKIPRVPALCPAPQLIAKLFVDAPGREIEMEINGISQHEFYNERRADVIAGGLRRGNNVITYTIKGVEGEEAPSLGIGLFVMPETDGNQPIVVFEHILDANDTAKGGSFNFTVSNQQIAAMNPKYEGAKPVPFRPVPLKQKEAAKTEAK